MAWCRGFGVRVTDKGAKTAIFQARFPGSANQSRREIAKVDARAAGATSLRAIAAGLNEQDILTARGTAGWSAVQVARVPERL
jgi:hypothetical protein